MAVPIPVLINGSEYEYSDIALTLLGSPLPIAGVTEISYGETQDSVNLFGAGNRPVARGYGKIEATASITLYMSEVENITTVAAAKNLMNIPEFDVTIIFLTTTNITRKHVLKNCRFKNNMRESKSGDQSLPVKLELLVSHIEW